MFFRCACQWALWAQGSDRSMVKSCYKCGTRSFGRCSNGCPKIPRFQSPKDKDFRLICFKCFQQVAKDGQELLTNQFQQHYLSLNKRLEQMQEQLDAAAASSAEEAKKAEEPEKPEEPMEPKEEPMEPKEEPKEAEEPEEPKPAKKKLRRF